MLGFGVAVESEGMQQIHTAVAIVYMVFMFILPCCSLPRLVSENHLAHAEEIKAKDYGKD
jgi:hypothetical protein